MKIDRVGILIVLLSFFVVPVLGQVTQHADRPESHVLPDWFEQARVQAHSEHNLEIALRLTPQGHAEAIRSLGADVLTRIFLNMDEGAWWPSKVGEISPLIGDRDFALEIAKAVHGTGMKVIAYHRHMSDAAMQKQHPDWVCKHPDGSPVCEPRCKCKTIFVICMNSPYRDYISTRLLELADRGVDGIYFDSWHMPPICVCDYCRKAFREEMGHDLDLSAKPGSPGYLEGTDFVNRSMVRGFNDWYKAVRAKHPNVFFAVGSSQFPLFIVPHIDSHLLAIADTPKTEFQLGFGGAVAAMSHEPDFVTPDWGDQVALGWSLNRDSAGGRPPLMWIPHIRSERTALYSSTAAVTYGCIASMNVTLRNLDKDAQESLQLFRSSFDMGKKISPHLAYTRPIPWAAIHVSEKSRNARLGDMKRMWREFFSPTLGAVAAVKQSHVPWVSLNDNQLVEGLSPDTRVLILPWPEELTSAQQQVVKDFEKRAGHVVRLDPAAGWSSKVNKPDLLRDLRATIKRMCDSAPVRVEGPERMHAVCFRSPDAKRIVVCLANSWSWFRCTREPDPKLNDGTEPPPCADISIVLPPSADRPKKVFDAIGGRVLFAEPAVGAMRVSVPAFQVGACVVLEY